MDLAKMLDSSVIEQGADLHLVHPATGKPLTAENGEPITVRLLGIDSETYRTLEKEVRHASLERMQKKLGRRGTPQMQVDPEQIEEDALNMMVKCTKSWANIIYKGKPLDCTPANVKMLYQEQPWIAEQVSEFMNDRRNFLGNSPTNSSSGQNKSSS